LLLALLLPLFLLDREVDTLNQQVRDSLGGSYLTLPSGVVHYELVGASKKPTVVLVHGISTPLYVWDRNVTAIQDAGYRVLRFDLFGRGYSDRPESDYGLDLYVNQLSDLVSELKIQSPVHLVGMSMGGPIVARFASKQPDRVASVTLIAPLVESPALPAVKWLRLPIVGTYLSKVILIPAIRFGLDRTVFDTSSFPDWQQRFDAHSRYEGYARALTGSVLYLDGKNFADDYKALSRRGKRVQVIWGLDDRIVPFSQHAALMNAMPDVPLHRIEQSGHLPHYEHPARVNPLLIRFFNRSIQISKRNP
jgi:pimeloyl-ACP methyl ester carboxylesterase